MLLKNAVEYLNGFIDDESEKIDYFAWDFKKISQSKMFNVVDELAIIAQWALQRYNCISAHDVVLFRDDFVFCVEPVSFIALLPGHISLPESLLAQTAPLSSRFSLLVFFSLIHCSITDLSSVWQNRIVPISHISRVVFVVRIA
jgi:hypothetical protein